jgi:HEAT repeat protein
MVREISLRGLQNLGGREASAALVELLKDPEPNVRAAVLKQLAEEPPQAMVAEVAKYLKTEADADLVVHGIRFLRAAGGKDAVRFLKPLLEHESWQVRAEAAEAIGQAIDSGYPFGSRFGEPSSDTADAYVALIGLLDDEDAFVVSRAVGAMEGADMAVAVEPLAKAAQQHPELAPKVVEILARGQHMRTAAVPHFRKLAGHDDPKIRAAAIGGLAQVVPGEMEEELAAGLKDPAGEVRIAAAGAVFQILEQKRSGAANELVGIPASLLSGRIVSSSGGPAEPVVVESPEISVPTLPMTDPVDLVGKLLGQAAGRVVKAGSDATEPEGEPAEVKPEPTGEQEASSEPAQEEEKPDSPATTAWDDWLATYYSEKKYPKWLEQIVPLLEEMLASDSAEQRAAAAIALVPLGRKDKGLPRLREAVEQEKRLLERAGAVLPWLVWPDRIALFEQLRQIAGSQGDLAMLVHALMEVPDRRAAEPFWKLLADPKLDDSAAAALYTGLQMAYFGQRYYDLSDVRPSALKALARDAKARVAEGRERQRVAALVLLAAADVDEAAAAARATLEDSSLSPALRLDAFHVALATLPAEEAAKRAVDALSDDQESWRKLALAYLVEGRSGLGAVRGQFGVQTPTMDVFSSGDGVDLSPPAGLKLEHVRPLVDDPEPKTAACAGYLLALFGRRDGMDKLLSYWRSNKEDRDTAGKLVYRAVAALDAAEYIPVLAEIYEELDEHEMSQFYWTIRVMTGREALQFRSRIRNEVGMEKLR